MKKLFGELARWWPLVSPPDHYAEEAEFFAQLFSQSGLSLSRSLLELGSGGGNNALHLKRAFARVTLSDLSPEMLSISHALNPECEHVLGDMRTLRLGRSFDVVFAHDAIDYMSTRRDLQQAIETAFLHCKPDGLALFVPDYVRETFAPATEHGRCDGHGRALRYLEWTYDPDESDTSYTVEYALLLREDGAPVRVEHEQHVCGLFSGAEWTEVLRIAGFQPEIVRDGYGRELFLARRRAGS